MSKDVPNQKKKSCPHKSMFKKKCLRMYRLFGGGGGGGGGGGVVGGGWRVLRSHFTKTY